MKILILVISLFTVVLAKERHIAIKGKLRCGEANAFGVLLRLWLSHDEKNQLPIAEEFTWSNGSFLIKGRFDTNSNHVCFKIYHDCGDGLKPGQRKLTFFVKTKYATDSANGEPYNFGDLNLETKFLHGEERVESIEKKVKRKRRQGSRTVYKKRRSSNADFPSLSEEFDLRIEPW